MSFTFRNLFSEEGEEPAPETLQEVEAASPDDIFSSPSPVGVREDSPSEGNRETALERTQSFLASELLPFIPPAISAKSGIPMEDELILRMPADGSNDVKLSVIYQVCPQLFAAEITPLNDSTVTLPAKLELLAGGEEESAVRLSEVAFGVNPFSADEETAAADKTEAKAAEAAEAGADGKVDEGIPFWCPEPLGVEAALEGKEFDEPASSFSTLFTEQAEGDPEIPFPESCEETVPAAGHGTWGTMFEAGFSAGSDGEDTAPVSGGFGDKLTREIKGEAEPGQNAPVSSPESVESEVVAPPAAEVSKGEPMPGKKKPDTIGLAAAAAFAESKSYDQEMPDLEMRAIFSSSDSFTLSRVARKIVELPDLMGCALATPVHLVQASRSEESRLGDEARETIQSVKNLAKLTGLPDAKSFTLQTDRGIISLFMEGSCCLIVCHNAPEFGPGIREKLILIARTMHKLND